MITIKCELCTKMAIKKSEKTCRTSNKISHVACKQMLNLGQYSSWGTKLPQVIDIESSKSISKLGQLNLPQFGIGANPKLGHNTLTCQNVTAFRFLLVV